MVKTKQVSNQNSRRNQSSSSNNLLAPHRKAIKSFSNMRRGDAVIKGVRLCKKSVINPAFKAVARVRKSVAVNRVEKPKNRFEVLSIPRRSFQVLCKELAHKYFRDCRFTKEALGSLQLAVEDFMVSFFEDAALCVSHAKRVTLMKRDFVLVCKLRKVDYIPL